MDDIVQRLIAQLDAAGEGPRPSVDFMPSAVGAMTARVLPFRQARRGKGEVTAEPGAVVDLPEVRKARADAKTVSGMFVYTARL